LHTAYVKELDILPFLALTTTTGAVQLWQGDIVQWTREEGLAALQVAEMVELPERKTIAAHIIEQDETFAERVRRQLADAKVRFSKSLRSICFMSLSGPATLYLPLCQKVCDGLLCINPSACSASFLDSLCT
jgi:hypothetical protein